jgi:hypothetical protein
MPVTRHPPCRPGRAVFPPSVPRLYSRPRCQAELASTHSSTFDLRDAGLRYLGAVEAPGKLCPGVAALLASPPVEPLERPVHGPTEKAGERAGVPSYAVLVVVAPSARLQVRGLRRGRDVIDPTGHGLVQGIPAGAEQVRIQAPIPLPQPVLLVRSCFVGSTPQGSCFRYTLSRSPCHADAFFGKRAIWRAFLSFVPAVTSIKSFRAANPKCTSETRPGQHRPNCCVWRPSCG